MSTQHSTLRSEVAACARRLAAAGLLVDTSGNVSARAGDHVAITATGADLALIEPAQVTVVTLDGALVEGDLAPSSELDLHTGIYRRAGHEWVGSVVHTHAPLATALSTVLDELPVIHYQQLALGGALRVAPFHTFGTPELADAVGAALDGRLGALMANHGAVAIGPTVAKAEQHAVLLEWLCTLYWRATAIGEPRQLTTAQQQGVIEHAVRIGYGATKQAQG